MAAAITPDRRRPASSLSMALTMADPALMRRISALIRAEIRRMRAGSAIVSAMDNDEAGRRLSGVIAAAIEDSGRSDVSFVEDLPAAEGDDWNDLLKGSEPPAPPSDRSRYARNSSTAKPQPVRPRRPISPK